jgi:ribosomal protein S18 acetylase RimI-like enzyme
MNEFMENYRFVTYLCRDEHDWTAAQKGLAVIDSGLGRNITEKTGITEFGPPIRVLIRDKKDEIVGGVFGELFGGWLYISVLWVKESLRNNGLGTKLMDIIEVEATKLDCTNVHLETFSFEAPRFYEHRGYEVFAVLDNYPKEHSKYFLKKQLAP